MAYILASDKCLLNNLEKNNELIKIPEGYHSSEQLHRNNINNISSFYIAPHTKVIMYLESFPYDNTRIFDLVIKNNTNEYKTFEECSNIELNNNKFRAIKISKTTSQDFYGFEGFDSINIINNSYIIFIFIFIIILII